MPIHFDPVTSISTAAGVGGLGTILAGLVAWHEKHVRRKIKREDAAAENQKRVDSHDAALKELKESITSGSADVERRCQDFARLQLKHGEKIEALAQAQGNAAQAQQALTQKVGELAAAQKATTEQVGGLATEVRQHVEEDRTGFELLGVSRAALAGAKGGECPPTNHGRTPRRSRAKAPEQKPQ